MRRVLDFLVKAHVEKIKQPVFKLYSSQIEILREPIDFYLQLHKGVKYSSKRILMSTLYLGTGNLEKYLVAQIDNSIKRNKKLKVGFVMDYMRGTRVNRRQESSLSVLEGLKKDNLHNNNVKLAFYYHPNSNKLFSLDTESGIREIFGVHHMKFYVFDNDVILSGANLSEDYFIERQDRYFLIKNAPELANYLQDLYDVIANNSYQVKETGELALFNHQPDPIKNVNKFLKVFKNQFNVFLFSNALDPKAIKLTEEEMKNGRIQTDDASEKQRNESMNNVDSDESNVDTNNTSQGQVEEQEEDQEIIDLAPDNYFEENKAVSFALQEKKEKAATLLRDSFNEIEIGHILAKLERTFSLAEKDTSGGDLAELGGPVYLFPTLQIKALGHVHDEQFFLELLDHISKENGYSLKIASGYMNFTEAIAAKILNSKSNYPVDLLTAAPSANGFFEGGRVKGMVPYFYRYFEYALLNQARKQGRENLRINEYSRGQWTFHSKGIWLYDDQDQTGYPVFSAIGSSNYCNRSYQRDTELQMYIYSECPKLSKELHQEQQRQFQTSEEVTNLPLTYKQYGLTLPIVMLAKLLKSFL